MTHSNSPPDTGCSIIMYAVTWELVYEIIKSGLNLGENATIGSVHLHFKMQARHIMRTRNH